MSLSRVPVRSVTAFGVVLRPEIAALSMSGSSQLVALNALSLKRLRLPRPPTQKPATALATERLVV